MNPNREALDTLRRLESSHRVIVAALIPSLLIAGLAIGLWVGWETRAIVSERGSGEWREDSIVGERVTEQNKGGMK